MGLAQSTGTHPARPRLRNARRNRRLDPRHPKTHPDPDTAPTAVVRRVDHNLAHLGLEGCPQMRNPAQSGHCPSARHRHPTPESGQGRWAMGGQRDQKAVAQVTQN